MNDPITATPEQIAAGVDWDCGPCAEGGIERLQAIWPDVDWYRAVHVAQRHEDENAFSHYWCTVCDE